MGASSSTSSALSCECVEVGTASPREDPNLRYNRLIRSTTQNAPSPPLPAANRNVKATPPHPSSTLNTAHGPVPLSTAGLSSSAGKTSGIEGKDRKISSDPSGVFSPSSPSGDGGGGWSHATLIAGAPELTLHVRPNEEALGQLKSYAARNPERLPKIVQELYRRIKRHINKRNHTHVDKVLVSVRSLYELLMDAQSIDLVVLEVLEVLGVLFTFQKGKYRIRANGEKDSRGGRRGNDTSGSGTTSAAGMSSFSSSGLRHPEYNGNLSGLSGSGASSHVSSRRPSYNTLKGQKVKKKQEEEVKARRKIGLAAAELLSLLTLRLQETNASPSTYRILHDYKEKYLPSIHSLVFRSALALKENAFAIHLRLQHEQMEKQRRKENDEKRRKADHGEDRDTRRGDRTPLSPPLSRKSSSFFSSFAASPTSPSRWRRRRKVLCRRSPLDPLLVALLGAGFTALGNTLLSVPEIIPDFVVSKMLRLILFSILQTASHGVLVPKGCDLDVQEEVLEENDEEEDDDEEESTDEEAEMAGFSETPTHPRMRKPITLYSKSHRTAPRIPSRITSGGGCGSSAAKTMMDNKYNLRKPFLEWEKENGKAMEEAVEAAILSKVGESASLDVFGESYPAFIYSLDVIQRTALHVLRAFGFGISAASMDDLITTTMTCIEEGDAQPSPPVSPFFPLSKFGTSTPSARRPGSSSRKHKRGSVSRARHSLATSSVSYLSLPIPRGAWSMHEAVDLIFHTLLEALEKQPQKLGMCLCTAVASTIFAAKSAAVPRTSSSSAPLSPSSSSAPPATFNKEGKEKDLKEGTTGVAAAAPSPLVPPPHHQYQEPSSGHAFPGVITTARTVIRPERLPNAFSSSLSLGGLVRILHQCVLHIPMTGARPLLFLGAIEVLLGDGSLLLDGWVEDDDDDRHATEEKEEEKMQKEESLDESARNRQQKGKPDSTFLRTPLSTSSPSLLLRFPALSHDHELHSQQVATRGHSVCSPFTTSLMELVVTLLANILEEENYPSLHLVLSFLLKTCTEKMMATMGWQGEGGGTTTAQKNHTTTTHSARDAALHSFFLQLLFVSAPYFRVLPETQRMDIDALPFLVPYLISFSHSTPSCMVMATGFVRQLLLGLPLSASALRRFTYKQERVYSSRLYHGTPSFSSPRLTQGWCGLVLQDEDGEGMEEEEGEKRGGSERRRRRREEKRRREHSIASSSSSSSSDGTSEEEAGSSSSSRSSDDSRTSSPPVTTAYRSGYVDASPLPLTRDAYGHALQDPAGRDALAASSSSSSSSTSIEKLLGGGSWQAKAGAPRGLHLSSPPFTGVPKRSPHTPAPPPLPSVIPYRQCPYLRKRHTTRMGMAATSCDAPLSPWSLTGDSVAAEHPSLSYHRRSARSCARKSLHGYFFPTPSFSRFTPFQFSRTRITSSSSCDAAHRTGSRRHVSSSRAPRGGPRERSLPEGPAGVLVRLHTSPMDLLRTRCWLYLMAHHNRFKWLLGRKIGGTEPLPLVPSAVSTAASVWRASLSLLSQQGEAEPEKREEKEGANENDEHRKKNTAEPRAAASPLRRAPPRREVTPSERLLPFTPAVLMAFGDVLVTYMIAEKIRIVTQFDAEEKRKKRTTTPLLLPIATPLQREAEEEEPARGNETKTKKHHHGELRRGHTGRRWREESTSPPSLSGQCPHLSAALLAAATQVLPFVLRLLWHLHVEYDLWLEKEKEETSEATKKKTNGGENDARTTTQVAASREQAIAWQQVVLAILAHLGIQFYIPALTEYVCHLWQYKAAHQQLSSCFSPSLALYSYGTSLPCSTKMWRSSLFRASVSSPAMPLAHSSSSSASSIASAIPPVPSTSGATSAPTLPAPTTSASPRGYSVTRKQRATTPSVSRGGRAGFPFSPIGNAISSSTSSLYPCIPSSLPLFSITCGLQFPPPRYDLRENVSSPSLSSAAAASPWKEPARASREDDPPRGTSPSIPRPRPPPIASSSSPPPPRLPWSIDGRAISSSPTTSPLIRVNTAFPQEDSGASLSSAPSSAAAGSSSTRVGATLSFLHVARLLVRAYHGDARVIRRIIYGSMKPLPVPMGAPMEQEQGVTCNTTTAGGKEDKTRRPSEVGEEEVDVYAKEEQLVEEVVRRLFMPSPLSSSSSSSPKSKNEEEADVTASASSFRSQQMELQQVITALLLRTRVPSTNTATTITATPLESFLRMLEEEEPLVDEEGEEGEDGKKDQKCKDGGGEKWVLNAPSTKRPPSSPPSVPSFPPPLPPPLVTSATASSSLNPVSSTTIPGPTTAPLSSFVYLSLIDEINKCYHRHHHPPAPPPPPAASAATKGPAAEQEASPLAASRRRGVPTVGSSSSPLPTTTPPPTTVHSLRYAGGDHGGTIRQTILGYDAKDYGGLQLPPSAGPISKIDQLCAYYGVSATQTVRQLGLVKSVSSPPPLPSPPLPPPSASLSSPYASSIGMGVPIARAEVRPSSSENGGAGTSKKVKMVVLMEDASHPQRSLPSSHPTASSSRARPLPSGTMSERRQDGNPSERETRRVVPLSPGEESTLDTAKEGQRLLPVSSHSSMTPSSSSTFPPSAGGSLYNPVPPVCHPASSLSPASRGGVGGVSVHVSPPVLSSSSTSSQVLFTPAKTRTTTATTITDDDGARHAQRGSGREGARTPIAVGLEASPSLDGGTPKRVVHVDPMAVHPAGQRTPVKEEEKKERRQGRRSRSESGAVVDLEPFPTRSTHHTTSLLVSPISTRVTAAIPFPNDGEELEEGEEGGEGDAAWVSNLPMWQYFSIP